MAMESGNLVEEAEVPVAVEDPYGDVQGVPDEASHGEVPAKMEIKWEVHPSPYGRPYYFNPATKESRWTLPTGPRDVVVMPAEAQKSPDIKEQSKACESSDEASSSSEGESKVAALGRVKTRLEGFRELLVEKKVGSFDRYETWLPRLLGDKRFTSVPMAERKALFQQEVKRLQAGNRKAEAAVKRSGIRAVTEIVVLCKEQKMFEGVQTIEEALAKISGSTLGNDDRWRLAHASDQRRLVLVAFDKELQRRKSEAAKAARDFRLLLQETVLRPDSNVGVEPPSFGDARRVLRHEERWKAVDSVATRQRVFAEVSNEVTKQWIQKKRQQAEEEDELLERRKRSRQTTSENEFRELLQEHIRCPLGFTWREVRVVLASIDVPKDLDEAGQEMIFNRLRQEHHERRLALFSDTLHKAEVDDIGPELSFQEAHKLLCSRLGGDARIKGVPEADLKNSWEDWRSFRLQEAMDAMKTWMRQCVYLTEVSSDPEALTGSGEAFQALCAKLASDKRYKRLEPLARQRTRLIVERLQELANQRARGLKTNSDSEDDAAVDASSDDE